MSRVYVSDTNIWIDFRNGGLLNELFTLPFTICCTDFVFSELGGTEQGILRDKGLIVESLDSTAVGRLMDLMAAHNNSSLADVSCYLLAQDSGLPLLTGDRRLRKQAELDGLQVHGVLWLLDQLVVHQVISPARAAEGLQHMRDAGARFPAAECQDRLARWAV
jgi:predicted nucleic acid-binding protein